MVTKFITFSPKNYLRLYFQWRNSITGWTISKVSTSFHHALMVLEISWSAMKYSDGQLRYSRKTRGAALHPLLFPRVNMYPFGWSNIFSSTSILRNISPTTVDIFDVSLAPGLYLSIGNMCIRSTRLVFPSEFTISCSVAALCEIWTIALQPCISLLSFWNSVSNESNR